MTHLVLQLFWRLIYHEIEDNLLFKWLMRIKEPPGLWLGQHSLELLKSSVNGYIGALYDCGHHDEFHDFMAELCQLIEVDKMKVIFYSSNNADVYNDSVSGSVLIGYQKPPNGEWKVVNWKRPWSKTGSADDYICPYIC